MGKEGRPDGAVRYLKLGEFHIKVYGDHELAVSVSQGRRCIFYYSEPEGKFHRWLDRILGFLIELLETVADQRERQELLDTLKAHMVLDDLANV